MSELILDKTGEKTFLVGGAVRDDLLGIPVYDKDWVVVGSSPAAMLAAGFEQVGKDFPVFLHPKTKEEYALARMERKSGQGYHGFEVRFDESVTLEEDLIRRDLTINAMARDEAGLIVDPYGGQKDLESKRLRHVSAAFVEDPLRVLRVARFAAKLSNLGFKIAPETLALMRELSESGELSCLTSERVWQEVVKALSTETPSVFFEVLRACGALAVLFPEVDKLFGVAQPEEHHPEGCAGVHSLMVLDAAAKLSSSLEVRFAALVHDLGKGLTPPALWPKHHGHEQAGVPLVKKMVKRYKLPNRVARLAEKVTEFHGIVHQGLDKHQQPYLKPKTYLKVLLSCQGLKKTEFFEQLLTACEADAKGRLGFEARPYRQKAFWLGLAQATQKVDNQALVAQGFQGEAMAQAIEVERLRLIKSYLANYSPQSR